MRLDDVVLLLVGPEAAIHPQREHGRVSLRAPLREDTGQVWYLLWLLSSFHMKKMAQPKYTTRDILKYMEKTDLRSQPRT